MTDVTSYRAVDAATVKGWARQVLGTAKTVLVTEIHCAKAECSGVETVIAVLDSNRKCKVSFRCSIGCLTYEIVRCGLTDCIQEQT
jgi:predicted aspartyl protease